VLRNNTERQEAIDSGSALLVGEESGRLTTLLESVYSDGTWIDKMKHGQNPFGDGRAAARISDFISTSLSVNRKNVRRAGL
jgi:UDP-N-acetylglucosamine 2-epimerase